MSGVLPGFGFPAMFNHAAELPCHGNSVRRTAKTVCLGTMLKRRGEARVYFGSGPTLAPCPQYRQTKAKTCENPLTSFTRPQCGHVASQDSISITTRWTSATGTKVPHSLQWNSRTSATISMRQPQQSVPKSS